MTPGSDNKKLEGECCAGCDLFLSLPVRLTVNAAGLHEQFYHQNSFDDPFVTDFLNAIINLKQIWLVAT